MSSREEAFCGSLMGDTGPGGEEGGDMTVVPRQGIDSLVDSSNFKWSSWADSGALEAGSWTSSAPRSDSGDGSRTWNGLGSCTGSGVSIRIGSESCSCTAWVWLDISSEADGSTAGSSSSGPATTAAAVAIAAAAATATAISFPGSATVTALGPRFTGVGVLLPTVFLGMGVLAEAALEPGVLGASLEGVALLSALARTGVFVSAALLAAGFLAAASDFEADLGVSGFADFVVKEGRVRGDSAGFLDAEVAGLVTSFFTGVVFLDVCDAGGLPPEGVVEVSLEAAGLAVVEEVFGVVVLAAAGELLVVLEVGGRGEPVAGRDDAGVPGVDLGVLEIKGLGEAAALGLVGVAEAVLGAGGFLAAAAVPVLTPVAVADAVFLAAVVVPVIDFASLVAEVPVGFFSPTLLLEARAGVVPVVFLIGAGIGAIFFTAAGAVFFATPLVWGFDTPFERRLWDVLGRDPGVVLVGPVVPGFVLAVALLVVLALESPAVLLLVLAAGVSLAWSGLGSTWPVSAAGC